MYLHRGQTVSQPASQAVSQTARLGVLWRKSETSIRRLNSIMAWTIKT